MVAIHLRNVPLHVHEALRRRAKANRRSMQQELLVILEEAAGQAPDESAEGPPTLHIGRGRPGATYGREEIYDDDGR